MALQAAGMFLQRMQPYRCLGQTPPCPRCNSSGLVLDLENMLHFSRTSGADEW